MIFDAKITITMIFQVIEFLSAKIAITTILQVLWIQYMYTSLTISQLNQQLIESNIVISKDFDV